MSFLNNSKLGVKCLFKVFPFRLPAPCLAPSTLSYEQVRFRTTKHWNPKFKKLRAAKFIKVDLPDFEEENRPVEDMTREEIRSKMKEKGLLPQRPWMERPMYISCTGGTFEAYVPPEGDGKVSSITKEGAKQKFQFVEKKGRSMLAMRKIRNFDEDFELSEFVLVAQEVYKNAHETLMQKDKENLTDFVTEKAYPEIIHNTENKTIRWKFIQSIDPPRAVQVRSTDVITKTNIFAQITVRFHTQQMLAVYDRFGRLLYGSELVAKDVLEYVVFERHMSNQYGRWRVHGKIIPDWVPPPEPSAITYRLKHTAPPTEEQLPTVIEPVASQATSTSPPQLATQPTTT